MSPLVLLTVAALAVSSAAAAPGSGVARAQASHHVDEGEAYLRDKQPAKALVEFQSAYDLDPDPLYKFYMAHALRAMGQIDQALAAAETALAAATEVSDRDLINAFIAKTREQRSREATRDKPPL